MKKLPFLILLSVLSSCATAPPAEPIFTPTPKTDRVLSWFGYHDQCVKRILASETILKLEYNAAEAKEVRKAIERDVIDWSYASELTEIQYDEYICKLEVCKGEESLAYVETLIRLDGDVTVRRD